MLFAVAKRVRERSRSRIKSNFPGVAACLTNSRLSRRGELFASTNSPLTRFQLLLLFQQARKFRQIPIELILIIWNFVILLINPLKKNH